MHPLMQHHIPDDQTFEITVSLHHTKLFLLTEFLLAYLTILSESADPVALLVWWQMIGKGLEGEGLIKVLSSLLTEENHENLSG